MDTNVFFWFSVIIILEALLQFLFIQLKKEKSKDFFKLTIDKILLVVMGLFAWICAYYSHLNTIGVPLDKLHSFWGRDWPYIPFFILTSYLLLSLISTKKEGWLKVPGFGKALIEIFVWGVTGLMALNLTSFFLCGCITYCDNLCFKGTVIIPIWIILGIIAIILRLKNKTR
jgi:hypothetical protein